VADPREDATHARAQVTAGPRVSDGTIFDEVDALTPGMKVAIATGGLAGNVYEYIGVEQTDSNLDVAGNQKFDLSLQDHRTPPMETSQSHPGIPGPEPWSRQPRE
jgi:hypothetical protein